MFIGMVCMCGDVIEIVKIDTTENAVATRAMADYVYENYNRVLGNNAMYYYEGSLRNFSGCKDITSLAMHNV
jgi:hypothetical protein